MEEEGMTSASADTKNGSNDFQEDNLAMRPVDTALNKQDTVGSSSTDTDSEMDNHTQNSGGKEINDETFPKEIETTNSDCRDTQPEMHDKGKQNEEESVATNRSARLEHDPSWSSSMYDLEPAKNYHSTDFTGLHSPAGMQDFRQNQSNVVLPGDEVYPIQVSKTTVVQKSAINEGLALVNKESEVITTVNKALEDFPLGGKSIEEMPDYIRDKNLATSKPSTSVSHMRQKAPDLFLQTSSTLDNTTADEDEELREHWTRTLQTTSSTGEIVEEIVRVLKHQKTHDLLCPVCGSCVTKRVILRKRKRSSLTWYQDEIEDKTPPMVSDEVTVDTGLAYGCLACFSLFFEKGYNLWSQVEGVAEQSAVNCLPFFFPPYPWGKNQHRKIRPELVHPPLGQEIVTIPETFAQEVVQEEEVQIKPEAVVSRGEAQPWIDKCTVVCGLAPVLLPDFRWGLKGEETNIQVVEPEIPQLLPKPSEAEKPQTSTLASAPSTGYAVVEDLQETSALTTRPSSGFAVLEGILSKIKRPKVPKPELEVTDEVGLSVSATSKGKLWQYPQLLWLVGRVFSEASDMKQPLLVDKPDDQRGKSPSQRIEGETFSVVDIGGPSDYVPPSLALPGLESKVPIKLPVHEDQPQVAVEVQPDEQEVPMPGAGILAGTTTGADAAIQPPRKEWDILRSIVYGGLDISVASIGVTSSAAGGDAITRTVVYMGVSTLLSGLIAFYHNVINLHQYHYEDYYKPTVGDSLLLHGTVAVISYIFFGMISSVTYAFSFRDSNNRDKKFALCCGVTFVSILILSLAKAHVTNKRFLRTVSAYIFGGFLAAIVGYLTGEHVSELLESWGI